MTTTCQSYFAFAFCTAFPPVGISCTPFRAESEEPPTSSSKRNALFYCTLIWQGHSSVFDAVSSLQLPNSFIITLPCVPLSPLTHHILSPLYSPKMGAADDSQGVENGPSASGPGDGCALHAAKNGPLRAVSGRGWQ